MTHCFLHFACLASLLVFVQGGGSNGGKSDPRFGFPIMQTQVVGNNTVSPTDMANQLLQSIPVIKLGLLSAISTFVAPILQGVLITAMILFALTGTASIICQMIDCSGVLNQGYGHGVGGYPSHITPISGFHHQHLVHHPNSMLNTYPRRRDLQRKPWMGQSNVAAMKDFEEALDKFGEN